MVSNFAEKGEIKMVDLEKIKAKLEALKSKNKGSGDFKNNFWTLKEDGESTIRMVKNPHRDPNDPYYEYWFHYNLGKPGIVCLKDTPSIAKPCPICEMGKELYQSGDKGNMELAKQFFPKPRYYGVIIDRDEENPTPKYWSFGVTVYTALLEALCSEDYSSYLNIDDGIDMVVKQVKASGNKKYPDTQFTFRRRESKLAATAQQTQQILDAIKPLSDIVKPISAMEMQDRIDKWLSPDKKEEEGEESGRAEVVKGGSKKNDRDNDDDDKEEKKSMDSIDQDFDELLG